MYKQLKKMRQEEGFTLIELLIVIVILGVLAGIVVFSVAGITDRGKTNACKADVATVTTAAEAFYAASTLATPLYAATMDDLSPKFLHAPVPADVSYTGGGATTPPTIVGIPAGC